MKGLQKTMTLSFLVFDVIGDCDEGFGISVTLPSGEKRQLRSLTFDRSAIEELCRSANRIGVSECQLYEIIEDFLP